MPFLSQLIKKPIYLDTEKYATVVDFGMPGDLKTSTISTLLLKKAKHKFAIKLADVENKDGIFYLKNSNTSHIEYNPDDFYLAEDLLDKQVIDITGKRMVRVNDVLLKDVGELKVAGIDVSFAGIIRRLGLNNIFSLKTVTIPWSAVEAFDYQTGDVRIKLGKSNLNTLHPAELADILEEAGTKEREGIVEVLSDEVAAEAIEESSEETQEALFEQLPTPQLKKILEKMPLSEIADVIDDVNPETFRRVLKLLGTERANRVEKLMLFPDDVAGGLMQLSYFSVLEDNTIGEVLGELSKMHIQPEAFVIVDKNERLIGQVQANELINTDPNMDIKELVSEAYFVLEQDGFSAVFRKFAQYNLRILPVVNTEKKVLGIITIDAVMHRIEEEEEKDESN